MKRLYFKPINVMLFLMGTTLAIAAPVLEYILHGKEPIEIVNEMWILMGLGLIGLICSAVK